VRPFCLGKWEAVLELRKHLRSIFRRSLRASDACLTSYLQDLLSLVHSTTRTDGVSNILVLREEGQRADMVSRLPNSDRSWGLYVFPQLRSEFMFVSLVLCRLGISRDLWLKIFLFSLGSYMDKEKACTAVLDSCSYLGRFWILDNQSSRGVSWGTPLFQLVFPTHRQHEFSV
jgi:hypothetical protein